jgi:hypothetical protein
MAASPTLQGAFWLASQRSPGSAWSLVHRVMFRFVFSFLALAGFPFPFNSFGGSVYPTGFYERMWFAATSWLCERVLHLPTAPSGAATLLLLDNTNGYVELLCFLVLATLATIGISEVARGPVANDPGCRELGWVF